MINISVLRLLFFAVVHVIAVTGCANKENPDPQFQSKDTLTIGATVSDTTKKPSKNVKKGTVDQKIVFDAVKPDTLLAFAKTLIGIPYLYASTDPFKGFDCSGFIYYVFNHFGMEVPRSSVDFTNFGKEISIENAKRGDLILFTGTDSTVHIVGHMGIVENIKEDTLYFIHSTSGKANGVVITSFGNYYRSRFVKVIRVLPEDSFK
jgi:cell wall-associated NlpC family hydrolase